MKVKDISTGLPQSFGQEFVFLPLFPCNQRYEGDYCDPVFVSHLMSDQLFF